MKKYWNKCYYSDIYERCKYCCNPNYHDRETLSNSPNFNLFISKKELIIEYSDKNIFCADYKIDIEYCPKCGRKL